MSNYNQGLGNPLGGQGEAVKTPQIGQATAILHKSVEELNGVVSNLLSKLQPALRSESENPAKDGIQQTPYSTPLAIEIIAASDAVLGNVRRLSRALQLLEL